MRYTRVQRIVLAVATFATTDMQAADTWSNDFEVYRIEASGEHIYDWKFSSTVTDISVRIRVTGKKRLYAYYTDDESKKPKKIHFLPEGELTIDKFYDEENQVLAVFKLKGDDKKYRIQFTPQDINAGRAEGLKSLMANGKLSSSANINNPFEEFGSDFNDKERGSSHGNIITYNFKKGKGRRGSVLSTSSIGTVGSQSSSSDEQGGNNQPRNTQNKEGTGRGEICSTLDLESKGKKWGIWAVVVIIGVAVCVAGVIALSGEEQPQRKSR